jgi:hypothetical protein
MGLEPTTPCLQSRCSSQLSYVPEIETSDATAEAQLPSSVSRMNFRHLWIRRALLIPPLIGLTPAIFWWTISQSKPFAVLDDYRMVSAVQGMKPFIIQGHAETEFVTGRVVPAFLFDLVWSGVESIQDLFYVRVLGLAVVVTAVLIFQMWFVTYARIKSPLALAAVGIFSFVVLLSPSVLATTTWAQKTTQLLALPLAILAGVLTTFRKLHARGWCAVIALIFLSVFCYQHFVAAAILPVACAWGANKFRLEHFAIRRLFFLLLMILIALIANVLFVRLVAPDVLQRVSGRSLSNRAAEAWDVLGKGGHLFVRQSNSLIAISLVVILSLFAICLLLNWKLIFLFAGVVFSVGCAIAVTIGGDGDSSYRMSLPTQFSLWLGLGSLISLSLDHGRQRKILILKGLALTLLICISAITVRDSQNTLHGRISTPNTRDWAELNCHLQSLQSAAVSREVVVRLAPIEIGGSSGVVSEIGLLARHVEWIFRDQLALAIDSDESLGFLNGTEFVVIDHDEELPTRKTDMLTIDLQTTCDSANW